MKRILKFTSGLLILLAIAVFTQRSRIMDLVVEWQKPTVEAVPFQETVTAPSEQRAQVKQETTQAPAEKTPEPASAPTSSLPSEYNLAIPFTSQAPLGVWDAVHEQTCEEASVFMVAQYFQQKPAGLISANGAEEELQRIIKFEDALFGYNEDTTASETALVIENYENLSTELVMNPTKDQIEQALVAGFPVIVPAAGQQLGNPYFKTPGPLYHMLVVKGYTAEGFITNDPGTRHGADYVYPFETLLAANHDWNGGDVTLGDRVMIIVKP